ncbi:TonB-dependent receptor [Brevundimonas sp.]|uniref:TonB-dependent receptor n=1 Tax=Brevundimonas sp. TaxID=1871086 RepID=UPI001E035FFC|nr:TonB-dependent receptor [Brevundimonas sp.]MBA4001292.1 TonB-dependent receptor [Brevundimonas sp.]
MKSFLMYSAAMSVVLFNGGSALAQVVGGPPDEVTEVDEIIVRGVRASLAQSIDIRRNSVQIVDSVVAEDIGKLPDNNVVEALQRVSGVQVTNRAGGEADGISIRGLPDISTTWNGRNIFTASGRQFALQDIPANLVRRIDVYKTRAADQLETGIAGQVDVFTRRPFDFNGPQVSLNVRGSYQEQGEYLDPNVSLLLSNRWSTGAGEVGALVNFSYVNTRYRDQSVTAGAVIPFADPTNPPPGFVPLERIFNTDGRVAENPIWQAGLDRGLPYAAGSTLSFNGVDYPYVLARDALFASDLTGERTRPAVNVALQWAPNDWSEYTFEFFYDGFRNETFNSLHFTFADWWGALGADPASTIEFYPGTNIVAARSFVGFPFGFQSGDLTESQTDSFVYALNADWQFTDRLNVVADLSYQSSEFQTDFYAMRTERVPEGLTLDFNDGRGLPSWHFVNAAGDNQDDLLLDPASWTVAQFYDNAGRAEGDALTLSIDVDYDLFRPGSIEQKFSFGFRHDIRTAAEYQRRPRGDVFLGQPLSSLDPGLQHVNQGFFDGRADVPTSWMVPNGYYIRDNIEDILALYGLPARDQLGLDRVFDITETTTSGYAMLDTEAMILDRPLMVQAGLRLVNVDTEMDFTDINSGAQSSAEQSIRRFLPSFTVRYDVAENFRLRFNYGETLRRPNFIDLNPNFSLTGDLTNVGYGTGSGGNPDLEATSATNFDLGAEWYFARDSALYLTLFRREIDGLVVPLTRRVTIPGSGLNTDSFVVTQPVNASDGVLEGYELGLVYFPDYLPGLLDGLGVQASLTSLRSSQNIPQTDSAGVIIGQENTSFFGVSDLSYNVTMAYERGGFGARLSYVWREDFLNNNEARIFANPIGIWRRPEQSLDFQASYNVNDRLAISFDAVNLTDELQQSYYAFGDSGGPDLYNFGSTLIGRTFSVGLRWSLY